MGLGPNATEDFYVLPNQRAIERRIGGVEREMAEKPQPVKVLYCGVCSLPAEYCEFGPDFEKCKPWLIQNATGLYPDLLKGGIEISCLFL